MGRKHGARRYEQGVRTLRLMTAKREVTMDLYKEITDVCTREKRLIRVHLVRMVCNTCGTVIEDIVYHGAPYIVCQNCKHTKKWWAENIVRFPGDNNDN